MGTHLIELSKIFPMKTNMAGFKRFSKFLCLWSLLKVASALKGLRVPLEIASGSMIDTLDNT